MKETGEINREKGEIGELDGCEIEGSEKVRSLRCRERAEIERVKLEGRDREVAIVIDGGHCEIMSMPESGWVGRDALSERYDRR